MATLLCILDGFGYNKDNHGNAISQANTPNLDKLFNNNPTSTIYTHGNYVGLPEEQMGNSEVGHITIGAGRTILQTLPRIDDSLAKGLLYDTAEYKNFISSADKSDAIHLLGLVSAGGVHSHVNHIVEIAKELNKQNKPVFIHAITDGRDVAPSSAKQIIAELKDSIADLENVTLADMIGRFYAMDRDNRAERTDAAFDLYTKPAEIATSTDEVFDASYAKEVYDEFLEATKLAANSEIKENDSIIVANFRADRARQITAKLINSGLSLNIATLTEFDSSFNSDVTVFFGPENVVNTIGEVVANKGLNQLRIAETEKYAHVTFFMNGGKEDEFVNEDRILVPSPQVATYDLQPEMSLPTLTEKLVGAINSAKYDLIICNVANGDMVGHTGSMDAAIKAVEAIDTFVEALVPALESTNSQMLLTADHGNCEEMLDENNKVLTKHSKNPVPICYFGAKDVQLEEGSLADLAPTILKLMDLDIPAEMTGKVLYK